MKMARPHHGLGGDPDNGGEKTTIHECTIDREANLVWLQTKSFRTPQYIGKNTQGL